MLFSLVQIITSVSVFMLIVLAGLLITSRKSTSGAKIMAVLMILNGLYLLGRLVLFSDMVIERPGIGFWTNAFPFTFGPLLWFYTRDVMFRTDVIRRKALFHFIPFVVYVLLTVFLYHLQYREDQLPILLQARSPLSSGGFFLIVTILMFLHLEYYAIRSILLVREYQGTLPHLYSYKDTVDARWLMRFIAAYALIALIAFGNALNGLGETSLHLYAIIALLFVVLAFASTTLYRALTFPHFFRGHQTDLRLTCDLSQKECGKLQYTLDLVMEEQQLYTRSFLNREVLAASLSISPEILSQLLYQAKNQVFYDYVNEKRVQLAKIMLTDPGKRNKTMIEIMYDVGFNSRRSFRKAFRKYTGSTPEAYRVGDVMRAESKALKFD